MAPGPKKPTVGRPGGQGGWKVRHVVVGVIFFAIGLKLGGFLDSSGHEVVEARHLSLPPKPPKIIVTAPLQRQTTAAQPLGTIRVEKKALPHLRVHEEQHDEAATTAVKKHIPKDDFAHLAETQPTVHLNNLHDELLGTAKPAVAAHNGEDHTAGRKKLFPSPIEFQLDGNIKDSIQLDPNTQEVNRIGGLECPAYDSRMEELQIPLKHLPRKKPTTVGQKYDRRAHNCASNGIWNRVTQKDHHRILQHMADLGHVKDGSFVLDWGSGCGHSLEWLSKEHGTYGLGIDVSNKTIAYARANTTKTNMHCVADGTRLEWLPSNAFDHVISFGSIYHVYNRTLFCHVIRQLVRVVKAKGTVYNGWTENAEFKRVHVSKCLDDLPVSFQIIEEKTAFADVEKFPLKSQQEVPNTYSLVVTKKALIPPEEEVELFDLEKIPIICDTHRCEKREEWVPSPAPPSKKGGKSSASKKEDAPQRTVRPKRTQKPQSVNADEDVATTAPPKKKVTRPATTTAAPIPTTTAAAEEDPTIAETTKAAEAEGDKHDSDKAEHPKADDASKHTDAAKEHSADGSADATQPPKKEETKKDDAEEAVKAAEHADAEIAAKVTADANHADGSDHNKATKPASPPPGADEAEAVLAEHDQGSAAKAGGPLAHFPTCPPYDAGIEALQIPLKHLPRKKKTSVAEKYDRRAHNCAAEGIWHRVTFEDHRLILKNAAKLIKLKKGESIFDWGCGCGQKLAFLSKEYDTIGLGIDVSNKTIAYAAENATVGGKNRFCVADGTKLGWIPSNAFDVSFSFGSVYHVYNQTTFCEVLRIMLRVTKAGGTLYNGWTENSEFPRKKIAECINPSDDLPHHDISIVEEKDAFKDVKTFPLKQYRKTPNTYSLLVRKRAGGFTSDGSLKVVNSHNKKDKDE